VCFNGYDGILKYGAGGQLRLLPKGVRKKDEATVFGFRDTAGCRDQETEMEID